MKIDHTYIEPEVLARKHLESLQTAGLKLKEKTILDIGCGTGTYTRLMAAQEATLVIGVDNTLGNVELAKQSGSGPNIRFICSNIEDWAFKGPYDLIFMRGSIYYLKTELSEIISNLVNMLVPGGELYVSFTNSSTKAILINTIKKIAAWMPETLHPAIRTTLAGLYYFMDLTFSSGDKGQRPDWDVIKSKMNTIFFPLTHLTDPATAERILVEHGMRVKEIFWGQSTSPKMADDYGILAEKKSKEELCQKTV